MSEHVLHGKPATDEQIQVWADEAEAGYDLAKLPNNGAVVQLWATAPGSRDGSARRRDHRSLTARAEGEGIATRSDAIRAAVREWAHVASTAPVRP